jgi:site-specific DNA-methyltransferase (adenine-specific)
MCRAGQHFAELYRYPLQVLRKENRHPHAKPLDWVRCLLGCCTDGVIYDPFAGSGTSLLAAEQLGRVCVAVEKEPLHCELIISRWEQFTGARAQRIGGGS